MQNMPFLSINMTITLVKLVWTEHQIGWLNDILNFPFWHFVYNSFVSVKLVTSVFILHRSKFTDHDEQGLWSNYWVSSPFFGVWSWWVCTCILQWRAGAGLGEWMTGGRVGGEEGGGFGVGVKKRPKTMQAKQNSFSFSLAPHFCRVRLVYCSWQGQFLRTIQTFHQFDLQLHLHYLSFRKADCCWLGQERDPVPWLHGKTNNWNFKRNGELRHSPFYMQHWWRYLTGTNRTLTHPGGISQVPMHPFPTLEVFNRYQPNPTPPWRYLTGTNRPLPHPGGKCI